MAWAAAISRRNISRQSSRRPWPSRRRPGAGSEIAKASGKRPASGEPQWFSSDPADLRPRGPWWSAFKDKGLDALEAQVRPGNQDVATALATMDRARAFAARSMAGLSPTVNMGGQITANKQSTHRPMRTSNPLPANTDYVRDALSHGLPINTARPLWRQRTRSSGELRDRPLGPGAQYRRGRRDASGSLGGRSRGDRTEHRGGTGARLYRAGRCRRRNRAVARYRRLLSRHAGSYAQAGERRHRLAGGRVAGAGRARFRRGANPRSSGAPRAARTCDRHVDRHAGLGLFVAGEGASRRLASDSP